MPLEYHIHHDLRLVWAEAQGILLAEDMFEYQRAVWGRADVQGYHELVDMRGVADIPAPSPHRVRALAALSASMDPPTPGSKFAIVASDDLAFGLGRMYQTHRSLTKTASKEVEVFRTLPEALDWLGFAADSHPLGSRSITPEPSSTEPSETGGG